MSTNFTRIFFLILCLFLGQQLFGQTTKVLLKSLLDQIEIEEKVSFSYETDLVSEIFISNYPKNLSLQEKINFLSDNSPFDFSKLDQGYYLIKPGIAIISIEIRDPKSDETIPGVYLKKNNVYHQAVSDKNGLIRIQTNWNKNDTLSFESIGYETQKVSLLQLIKSKDKLIKLKEGLTILDELIITSYLSSGIQADQKNHSIKIANGELGILPGDIDKDLLVSLKTLPGIHSVTGRAGELRIRGGTPDHNLILFNDIPILHKGYYFGTISPFSTDIVENVDVYRSGYTSQLGGRVGGAIVLSGPDKVPDSLNIGLATNSYFASAYLKTPLKKNKLGVTLSFRGAHPFNFISPKEKAFQNLAFSASTISIAENRPSSELQPVDFDFWDFNSSIIYSDKKIGDLKLNVLTINNTIGTEIIDDNMANIENRQFSLDNNGVSLSWKKKWKTSSLNFLSSISTYEYNLTNKLIDFSNNELLSDRFTNNRVNSQKLGLGYTYLDIKSNVQMQLGYEFTNKQIKFNSQSFNNGRLARRLQMPNNETANIHSFYGNILIPEWNKFVFDLGTRVSRYGLNNTTRIEPRIFTNYQVNKHFTLKTSFGLYSQDISQSIFFDLSDVPNEKLIWFFTGSRNRNIITSWQSLAGGTYQAKNWLFDFDFYIKEVDNVATSGNFIDQSNMMPVTRRLFGSLKSKGVDLLIKYKLNDFDFWTSYTISRAELFFSAIKTEPFPTNYDQTHAITIGATYQKDNFRASLGWFLNSGLPDYTEDRFFPSTGGRASGQFITRPTPLGVVQRFNSTHQLDASVVYIIRPQKRRHKITLGLSALNIYNRSNSLETALINQIRNNNMNSNAIREDRFSIGFAPDLMVKIEW